MYCTRKVTEDLIWVGANDRRLAMFEGVYSVPKGVSYNSYLLLDEKTVLFDTVDWAVHRRLIENLKQALNGRDLNYLIIQHMEPDHSAGIKELLTLYPGLTVVCNSKTAEFITQFFNIDINSRLHLVGEGDTLLTGKHNLRFINAPMVHWPEVMVTYDITDRILFSADAFGCFGALNGALFSDEVDFMRDYMDEARRYYTNIVGKYGAQVVMLLNKVSALEVDIICPLHGFIFRENINSILSKYLLWSSYTPEEYGVMIAYASVYGNTENAAEILAAALSEKGIKTVMYDVSVTAASEIVAASFRFSHLVFASTTYNMGIFVTMEAFLSDVVSHNIQNRTVALIENGSWAAASGNLMKEKMEKCKGIRFIENRVSIKSSVKDSNLNEILSLADALELSVRELQAAGNTGIMYAPEPGSMSKLSYGLFVISVK